MGWEEFTSAIGLPAVVGFVSAWLFTVWKDRISRNEQGRLDDRLKRLESSLSTAGHVQRSAFEKELRCYEELYAAIHECVLLTADFAQKPDDPEVGQRFDDGWKIALNVLGRNRPFYSREVLASAMASLAVFQTVMNMSTNLNNEPAALVEYFSKNTAPMADLTSAIRQRILELSEVPTEHEDQTKAERLFLPYWNMLRQGDR